MSIKIINTNLGIIIAGSYYPKNSITIGIEGVNTIQITRITGVPIASADYKDFLDEFDQTYSTPIKVIEDLSRSLSADTTFAFKMLVDEPTALVTYVGYAVPGSLAFEPKWMIQRITAQATEPPNITIFEWSVARGDKTSIWNDRVTINYVS